MLNEYFGLEIAPAIYASYTVVTQPYFVIKRLR
jgi:hypothetical protein